VSSCDKTTWQSLLQANFTFAEFPSSDAKYLPLIINDVYVRDHATGILALENVGSNVTRMIMDTTTNECLCHYVLEGVKSI
jgi:hypothetical protein